MDAIFVVGPKVNEPLLRDVNGTYYVNDTTYVNCTTYINSIAYVNVTNASMVLLMSIVFPIYLVLAM